MLVTIQQAQELKDRGFSQSGLGQWYDGDEVKEYYSPTGLYSPELYELIEACGERFVSLKRSINPQTGSVRWVVNDIFISEESPESAVASLLLNE